MMKFNRRTLAKRLDELPVRFRVAFALLAADRLMGAYQEFAQEAGRSATPVMDARQRLWSAVEEDTVDTDQLDRDLQIIYSQVPDEEAFSHFLSYPQGDDALGALYHAIKALSTGESDEAAASAERAYDARDNFVMSKMEGLVVTPEMEATILLDPIVQNELRQQAGDLETLARISSTAHPEAELDRLRRQNPISKFQWRGRAV